MKQIIGANHKVNRIKMALPVDQNGDYAFDENGKPVKGREPLVLNVPRFDSLDREQIKAIDKELKDLEDKTDDKGKPLSSQDKSLQSLSIMLRPFVTDEELRVVEKLKQVELDQIATYWQEQSTINLGELLASTDL